MTRDEEAELLLNHLLEYFDARDQTNDSQVTLEELAEYLIEVGYRYKG